MIDQLLLLSGNDIPFQQAQLIIHQPKIKEIAYITQPNFWQGCQLLKFDKEIFDDEDKKRLSNQSNFNIIMTMIQEKSLQARQAKLNLLSIIALMFPVYEIKIVGKSIQLTHIQTGDVHEINEKNFQSLKEILIRIFCLTGEGNKQYNPNGDLAKKIADKLKKGRQKRAQLEPDSKIAVLSRYISILAVGEHKDINELMNYTVYQLLDEFNRFQLKMHYDAWVQYKIAGATGMEDPEEWTKDMYD